LQIRLPGPNAPSWVLAESAASALFSLLSMLLIGLVIGPEAAGTGAIATAAFLLVDVLAAALFPDALCQRPGLSPRHVRSALAASVLLGTAAARALALAAPLLPFSAFSGTASGLAMRQHRFRLLALRVLAGQPLALAAGLLAADRGLGPWAMVLNQAVATLFTAALFLRAGRLPPRPLLDMAALRDLWPVAGPQVAALVLIVGKYRIFLLALGLGAAGAVVAHAHFAFRMLDAVLAVVWQAVARISMPRLSALQHDRPALARCYGELAQLQALLGLPLSIGIALTAPDLVGALLGPAWDGTAEAARVAGFAAALTFLHGDHFSLFVALGKARRNMLVAVANLLVPLAALAAVRPEEPAGIALAWGAPCLLVTPFVAWLALRELGRSPLWLAGRVAPAAIAASAMVPAVLLAQGALADAPAALRLLGAAAAGAVVYLPVALLALGARLPPALRPGPAPGPAFGPGRA